MTYPYIPALLPYTHYQFQIWAEQNPAQFLKFLKGESEMSFFAKVSKRKRIESLVKKSIEDGALAGGFHPIADHSIINLVKGFTEKWPRKYFDIADDRKVAGLVLAYMIEIAEIGVHHVNDHGYALLKLTAEVDLEGFRENTPRTFEFLRRINVLGSHA